jgi:hypothetical protein
MEGVRATATATTIVGARATVLICQTKYRIANGLQDCSDLRASQSAAGRGTVAMNPDWTSLLGDMVMGCHYIFPCVPGRSAVIGHGAPQSH